MNHTFVSALNSQKEMRCKYLGITEPKLKNRIQNLFSQTFAVFFFLICKKQTCINHYKI